MKASSIILMADANDGRLSARNQLAGTVTRAVPGAAGAAATVVFKASSVIIGVTA